MASQRKASPVLDAGDYDLIQATLAQQEDVPGVIAKARASGVDCDEYQRNHEYVVTALRTLLKEWFPKGRPR